MSKIILKFFFWFQISWFYYIFFHIRFLPSQRLSIISVVIFTWILGKTVNGRVHFLGNWAFCHPHMFSFSFCRSPPSASWSLIDCDHWGGAFLPHLIQFSQEQQPSLCSVVFWHLPWSPGDALLVDFTCASWSYCPWLCYGGGS